jgi:hypothetical protein
MVGELEAAAPLARQPVGPVLAGKRPLGDHVQVLQLLQKIVFESKSHWKIGAGRNFLRKSRAAPFLLGGDGGQDLGDDGVDVDLLGFAFEIQEQAMPERG